MAPLVYQESTTGGKVAVTSFTEEGVSYTVDLDTGKCSCKRGEIKGDDHKHNVAARALQKATRSRRTQRAREEVALDVLETCRAAYKPVTRKDHPVDSYRFACSVPFGPEIRRVAFERHAKVLAMNEGRDW